MQGVKEAFYDLMFGWKTSRTGTRWILLLIVYEYFMFWAIYRIGSWIWR